MSLWDCPIHGLYGGQAFCPSCGDSSDHVTIDSDSGSPAATTDADTIRRLRAMLDAENDVLPSIPWAMDDNPYAQKRPGGEINAEFVDWCDSRITANDGQIGVIVDRETAELIVETMNALPRLLELAERAPTPTTARAESIA